MFAKEVAIRDSVAIKSGLISDDVPHTCQCHRKVKQRKTGRKIAQSAIKKTPENNQLTKQDDSGFPIFKFYFNSIFCIRNHADIFVLIPCETN